MDLHKPDIDDNQFSGNELDDSKSDDQRTGNKSDKPDSIKKETTHEGLSEKPEDSVILDEEQSPSGKKRITAVHKISGIIILLCIITSAAYFFILRQPMRGDKPIAVKKISAKIKEQSLVFEPFIVPFESNKYYTYMLVEISFDVSGKELRLEITEKQSELRKIIYDILLNAIGSAESVPSVVEIKNRIKSGINTVLENGKIGEVFVTKYYAV